VGRVECAEDEAAGGAEGCVFGERVRARLTETPVVVIGGPSGLGGGAEASEELIELAHRGASWWLWCASPALSLF